jgi:CelD/BcsL family acetyltransferase involved in cellulose biosynthesis
MAVPARLVRSWARSESPTALRVTAARSADEVEALRASWVALQAGDLTTDIDYHLTLGRFHPEVLRPHALLVERGDEPVALLAAHLHPGWLVHRIGPCAVYKPTMRSLNVSYRGFVGERSPETIDAVLRALRGSLEKREADAILFRYLTADDALYRAARGAGRPHRREHFLPRRPHWSMEIGDSLEETLSRRSAKTRENIRRSSRRLENELGDRLRLDVVTQAADAPKLFAAVDAVAARAYQHENGTLFRNAELERQLALLGLARGWYRAHVLYVDEQPIAFWTGFSYGGTFGWRGATGYDPAYARLSPGTYVLVKLLEDLSRDPAVRLFDMGGGDVEYKRYFGDHRWEEHDVRLLGPGPRNLAVGSIGSCVLAIHQCLRRAETLGGRPGSATRLRQRRLKKRAAGRT